MAGVRQRGTAAELFVASALRDLGAAYRKNVKDLPGSPDFANKRRHWAVFVNGCFWHAHTGCRRATVPKTNRDFWLDKFRRNRMRDAASIWELRRQGFRVAVLWECECEGDEARGRLSKVLEPRRVDVP
jgi:DNA mismatch endonuclease Vsr